MSVTLTYLPLDPSEVPCQKLFDIEGSIYVFEFRYNERNDFYTMYIYDSEYNLLFVTKIVYWSNLITAVVEGLFTQPIRAFNIGDLFTDTLSEEAVTSSNLNNNVRLYLTNA